MVSVSISVLLHFCPAFAQEAGHIELKCLAESEIEVFNEKGEKEILRVKAAKVVPGDAVIYTIYCTAIGQEPVNDIVINNPVPEHMAYEEGSALGDGSEISFSIDQGKTFDSPENLKVKDAEGNEHPAIAKEYTHIRWILKHDVKPGQTGQVCFRARLE
ncbi:MAG: hypothetical protein ACMUIM_08060 [bacterium]